MKTQATARYIRVPASKARLVLEHIRGKSVGEALATLQFTPKAAARLIEKVLRSAIANAEHNHQVRNLDDLRVIKAIADGGPGLKRVSPRAMGRAYFIKHRTSHLTIELSYETPRPRGGVAAGGKVIMGQKTHPIGFRLGTTRTWSSRWFATKGYAALLHEDVKIRRFIKSALYHAGISQDRHRALGQPGADLHLHGAPRIIMAARARRSRS